MGGKSAPLFGTFQEEVRKLDRVRQEVTESVNELKEEGRTLEIILAARSVDVAEVYSPPRVTVEVDKRGPRAG